MVNHLTGNPYGRAIIACGWLFLTLGSITVGLRIWSRRLKKHKLQLNDWCAVGALIWDITLVIHNTQATVQLGLGQHASILGEEKSRLLLKSLIGLKPEWAFANALVKISILHLYIKIFERRWFKIAAWIIVASAILYSLAAFLEIFLSCFPMAFLWDPKSHFGGYCIDLSRAWLAVGLTNMIEDIIIIVLPLPVLWSLKMNTKRKINITAIFSLGILYVFSHINTCRVLLTQSSITIISGIRIKVILDFDPNDASYHLGPITFWSIMEPLLGLINCCLPVIQPAISRLIGDHIPLTEKSKRESYNDKPVPLSQPCQMGNTRYDREDVVSLDTVYEADSESSSVSTVRNTSRRYTRRPNRSLEWA